MRITLPQKIPLRVGQIELEDSEGITVGTNRFKVPALSERSWADSR